MGSRQSFANPHSRVPSAMIGQYTLKPDTHSNRDTGTSGALSACNTAILVKWSEKWQMLLNFGNVNVYTQGREIGPTGVNYEMGGTILSKTVKEKDLGVTMNANMKVSEQCRIAASKGNQVLGMIRRNITEKNTEERN